MWQYSCPIFSLHSLVGVKVLVRLRLRFSLFVKINLDIIHGFTISFPFRNLDIFLLEDAIVSSKTNPRAAAARIRREVMARNNEAKAETFSFISTLYLKQQTNILWCFSSSKFENSLFINKLFRYMFRSERKVYTANKDQMKYFVQN